MESYRQGDIGCFERNEIPEGYKLTEIPLVITGESGRHLHRFENVEVFTRSNTVVMERPSARTETDELGVPIAFVRALEGAKVVHDVKDDSDERPHEEMKLRPGTIYEVQQKRNPRGRRGD